MPTKIIRLFYTIVSIFPSGILISVGTKSPEQAQQDMNNAVKILVSECSIKPVNIKAELRIVAVQNIGTTVDLEEMSLLVDCIYARAGICLGIRGHIARDRGRRGQRKGWLRRDN